MSEQDTKRAWGMKMLEQLKAVKLQARFNLEQAMDVQDKKTRKQTAKYLEGYEIGIWDACGVLRAWMAEGEVLDDEGGGC